MSRLTEPTLAVPVVQVSDLSLAYGPTPLVRHVSFEVAAGEIVGLVGPNGAGKTSIVESVAGLRQATTGGTIRVCGIDPLEDRARMSSLVGIQLQESAFPSRARVGELCDLYERLYSRPGATRKLLKDFGLDDRRRSFITSLSGGMKQRLALVLAQVGDVRLVILDELTTGLDPEQRRSTWKMVRDLAGTGVAVLLTSHNMDEVETLCSRVGVLLAGSLKAYGSPIELVTQYGGGTRFSVDLRGQPSTASDSAISFGFELGEGERPGFYCFYGQLPEDYNRILSWMTDLGLGSQLVTFKSQNFEDAYLQLVGRTGSSQMKIERKSV